MIIELFGPPGAGKTTFAQALAARLRQHGHVVDLMLSHRPAERFSTERSSPSDVQPRQISSVVRRLARPFAEVLTMARHPFNASHDVRTALTLIRIVTPSSWHWSLRLAQYLSRLSRVWSRASQTGHIVLFDQAFVQAVGSLALFSRAADEFLISRALDEIPKSDLLVLLHAPTEVVEARLHDRERQESRMERLLELDLATNLRSLEIINALHALLQRKGRRVSIVTSLDQHSLQAAVNRVEKEVTAQFNLERRFAARRNPTCSDSFRADRPLDTPAQPLPEGN